MQETESIDEYILQHIDPESDYLKALYRDTHVKLLRPRMASGHLQGRMLKMFVKMIRPRQILEIGTYSGYSALCLAEGLSEGGMLHTFEINDEQEDFTRPWLEKSPFADKIRFYIGDALELVPDLGVTFDLAFIDGDKRKYIEYYEMTLAHLSEGGYMIADNTLWDGHVLEQPRNTDAQTIGKLQAEKMVSKLKLDKASKDNPKYIEVLLPYTAVDEKGNANDSTFAQEAFRGIWQVLGSYYQKGVVESPSGTLDGKSTENDWQAVAYDAAKEGSTAKVLDKRLAKTDGQSTLTRIDGIITMNDYIASEVVKELDDLGYTGSTADINPQITISGIVGNITGKKDLSRDAVPDPIKSPENDNANDSSSSDDDADKDTSASDKDRDSQWPLVTGYGAYVSNIPSIVNGKQWMTGMEDRQTIATDIAQACAKLNKDEALNSMPSIRNSEVGGVKKIPTISEPLLAVSASNLKSALIDPGYISLADAGL